LPRRRAKSADKLEKFTARDEVRRDDRVIRQAAARVGGETLPADGPGSAAWARISPSALSLKLFRTLRKVG